MLSFQLDRFSPVRVLRKMFSGKWMAVICFTIAVTNKLIISWLYTDLEADKSLYLLFTKSLLFGKGLTEPVSLLNGTQLYLPDNAAISPLYSLLCVPFLWLTNSYTATSLLADAFSWLVFFSALYKLGNLIFKEQWITNLLLLSVGFFLLPHELDSMPKDTLAVGLMLWSVCFAQRFIEAPTLKNALSVVAVLWLVGLTKYAYVPLLFVSFLMLFLACLYNKRLNWFAILFLFFSLIVLPYYWFFIRGIPSVAAPQLVGDGTVFIAGFYPGNWLSSYPFVSSAIINTNFWGVQLEDIFNSSFAAVTNVFRLIDVVLISSVGYLSIRIYKKKVLPPALLYALIFSVIITAEFFLLSLYFKAVQFKGTHNFYTYVQEGRVFLFQIITLQFLFFLILFKTYALPKGVKNFLFFLFLIECLHGAYFTVKQLPQATEVMAARSNASPVKKITTAILEISKSSGNIHLITTDNSLRRYATLHNIPVYAFSSIPCNKGLLPAGGYFIATHQEDAALLNNCFSASELYPLEGVEPFILHSYKKE